MKNSTITYSSEIIRDVAKELGVSEEKVSHILKFIISYLKILTLIPNIFAIYLPEIGQMYLSASHLKNIIYKLSSLESLNENQALKLKLAKERLELLESVLKPGYSPHKTRKKIKNNYFSKGKSMKELEEFQNK